MIWGILLSIITGIVWCGVGVVTSQITRRDLDYIAYGVQSGIMATVCAAALLVRWPALLAGTPPKALELVLVLSLAGILQAIGFWLMQRAMRDGPHALIWAIGQTALVVPFLANVFCWHEPSGLHRFLGLAMIATGIFVLGRSRREPPAPGQARFSWVLLAFMSFACLGLTQTLCTFPSHWLNWTDIAGLRVPLIIGSTCLGFALLRLISPRGKKHGLLRISAAGAAVTFIGSVLLFIAIDQLATVNMVSLAYPITVGTCIVAFSVYGRLFLAEPLGKTGLVLTIAGLVFISF